jgi:hypothetical protein
MGLRRVAHIFTFTALISIFLLSTVLAGQQDNVNYIIGKIRSNLASSTDAPDWKAKYSLVSKNIEDLRKTLALGGKVTSNPVKEHHALLSAMLDERKNEFQAYLDAVEKLQKNRKRAAKQAINDVGMEMISRLSSPKPGYTSPISQANTKNAKIIREDFARLRTIDEAINTIEGYKKSILPSIHAIRDRKHAMGPLVSQYASLTEASYDGSYSGNFGGNATGSISFTVKEGRVSGKMSGTSKGDSVRGSFSGSVDPEGNLRTSLTGSLTDSSTMKLGQFSFAGNLNGKINGSVAHGRWDAKNMHATNTGEWNVVRK